MKRCLWIFAALGPFFGYATVISLMVIAESDGVLDILKVPFAVVLAAPFGIPMAWFVGLIPAILIGIVYWALRSKTAVGALAALALSAVVAAVLCGGAIALRDGLHRGLLAVESWQIVIVPAIVATLLCGAIVERGSKPRYE
ncbi:MAG TPA: hypothetical protein VFU13_23195 [Steroidobacteraceae bacterium]|nr:hypothetical protein [Steroidobacteraceae bacterium]